MNILFIVPYYKPAYSYGGPIVVIAQLAETLVSMGHKVTVYTSTANGEAELPVATEVATLVDGVVVHYFRRSTGGNTFSSPTLWRYLQRTVRMFDVVHIHSWWNFLALGAAWICKRQHVPFIISPHGMLSKYILTTNNAAKKKVIHYLVGKRLLASSRVHVSTAMEWEESQDIIKGWPGQIIPNLITLPKLAGHRSKNEVFTIGFLSRIDPKKGLDILIKALALVQLPYQLLVAGAGTPEYTQELQNLAAKVGNADKIQWVGWKNGEAKFDFLAGIDLFALTSHSENFAIVVIEALATGTPVFISNQVGLHQFVCEHDYGWVTALNPEEVASILEKAICDKAKRQRITSEAPAAIREAFDNRRLAQQYLTLYTSSEAAT